MQMLKQSHLRFAVLSLEPRVMNWLNIVIALLHNDSAIIPLNHLRG